MIKHVAEDPKDGSAHQHCSRCHIRMAAGPGKGWTPGARVVQWGPKMQHWDDLRLYEVTGTELRKAPDCK